MRVKLWSRLRALNRSGPFWNMMGSGMMAASTVVMTMLVGHFSDLAYVGDFSLALTTAQILYSLALFGTNDLQMTDYHRWYRFNHYFGVKLFSTALATVVCAVVVAALRFNGEAAVFTWLLTAFMLLNSLGELYQSMFFQSNRLDLTGKAMFFRYFLSTVAFGAVLVSGRTIASACVWMIAVNVAATIWWDLRRAGEFRDAGYALEIGRSLSLIREALPLCLSVLGSLFVVNCPKYIINARLSSEVQGLYNILFIPTYSINLLSQFIFRPYLARYEALLRGDGKGFWRLLAKQAGVIAAAGVCLGVFMYLAGAPFLKLLFGQDVSGYRALMGLFMVSGSILAVNQLLYYIMVILRRQKTILLIFLTGSALTLLVGLAFIARFEISGAWMAFTAGQACILGGYALALHRAVAARSGKRDGKDNRINE